MSRKNKSGSRFLFFSNSISTGFANAVPLTLSRQDLTSLHTVQLRMVTDFNFKIAGDRGSEEGDAGHFDDVHQLTSAAFSISKNLAD